MPLTLLWGREGLQGAAASLNVKQRNRTQCKSEVRELVFSIDAGSESFNQTSFTQSAVDCILVLINDKFMVCS